MRNRTGLEGMDGRLPATLAALIGALGFAASDRVEAAPAAKRARKAAVSISRRAAPSKAPKQAPAPRLVLDIEKLKTVPVGKYPNAVLTCDVIVVGGGLGGVAAAEALAKMGHTVILTEPTAQLGGQLTSQAVTCPDENTYIEREPGVGTRAYRLLREQLRAKYAAMPGIKPSRAGNVGGCWVSRLSGEPKVWEEVIRARLAAVTGPAGLREILTRNQLVSLSRFPHSGRYHYADFVNLDTGRYTRVAAQYMLDATEMGDVLPLAGQPWRVGAEARSDYNEPHAPQKARPDWVQSLTYCFNVRWQPEGPHETVEKPAEYEYFKSLGEYTLGYDYIDRGRVYYKVFEKVPNSGGPFWTYRRIIAASSFAGNPKYGQDIALINWRGNDFHEENPVGKTVDEQVRILKRAKAFAQGFLYWLQTECPRDDGKGIGYPEMQLSRESMGSDDGFALHPYIRESRRLVAEFMLTENHLAADPNRADKKWGEEFADSVGLALYSMDIHPAKGEPPFLVRALPYHIPLGSFVPKAGAGNVLPAAKNFGATRLALSSARMHPTEWLVGEVSGQFAGFCLRRQVDPPTVRNTPSLLAEFQDLLRREGHPLKWSEIIK